MNLLNKAITENPTIDFSKANYINYRTKLELSCRVCGKTFFKSLRSFKGCPFCNDDKHYHFSSEEFKQFAEEHYPKFDFSKSNYVNSKTKIKVICKDCGNELEVTPNNLRFQGCSYCYGNKKLTTSEFIERAKLVHGNDYGYSKLNYINATTKVEIFCNRCKVFFWQAPYAHINFSEGCPYCKSSNGERDISNLLEENKIAYMREYSFEECRDIKPLPFDFYLPKENILIEYNGEQHYSFNPFFHKSPENFERQKCHDKIKRDFCFKKGLELIVISYKDSIKEILCKRLKLS